MTIEMGGMARAEPPARHTPPPRNQRDGAEAARASPRNHGDRAPPGAEVTSGKGAVSAAQGAMADPSLLSAELEADEEEEAALRRLLLQVTPDREEAPRPGPTRAVTPQPGLCVKTRAGGDKVFVNVCHSPEVPPPPPVSPPGLQRLLREPPGPDGGFRIPMSLGEPHAELDRGGRGCTAYDVVVNSGFFRTLQADPLYLEFFLTVAMEGLSEKYGVELELTGWRVLRNRKFLGSISAQNIRARPRPHIQELPGPPDPPQFVVVAEPSAQEPQVLQARVHLPQVEGAGSLWLGLSEERLLLLRPPPPGGAAAESGAGPPARQGALLELGLPLPADPARCRARFHRRSKVLTVTMPLRA
ncbi:PIH1 domain-containing protein 1 isoform X1 [Vidua chalybeata]|uniref:PIH1 domain-containing protein 1 isoform X1 n=2 Tax=Vidua chalybeata TaxID=81927 RepID=UPI0023A882A1|nr:PIH1 domain-containing protein 1 isoform X1 [Vidua chalybeata]